MKFRAVSLRIEKEDPEDYDRSGGFELGNWMLDRLIDEGSYGRVFFIARCNRRICRLFSEQ